MSKNVENLINNIISDVIKSFTQLIVKTIDNKCTNIYSIINT